MKHFVILLTIFCLLASACGNDDDSPADAPLANEVPAPEPTEPAATPEPTEAAPEPTEPAATPEPTEAAPEPTAAPDPTAAAEEEEPALSMDTLIVNAATTGHDVLQRLSDAERECIQTALGDDYGLLQVAPLAAVREVGVDVGLFGCLTHENVLTVGSAYTGLQYGERTPETSACTREVYRSNPTELYRLLNIEWEGSSSPSEEGSSSAFGLYQCLNPRERIDFVIRIWSQMSTTGTDVGGDYVSLLTADEIQCANEGVGGEETAIEVMNQNPIEVWRSYPAVHDCFPPATMGRLLAQVTSNQLGGISDSSFQCIVDFSSQRPEFVLAIANGPTADSLEDIDPDQFTMDVLIFYGCLSSEEQELIQNTLFSTD